MTFISLLMIICIILRAVLFNQRGEKAWKTIIPFYNKYVLGKLSDSKKLGIITAITSALYSFLIIWCYSIELTMLSLIPAGTDFSTAKVKDFIPEDLVLMNSTFKTILLIVAIIYLLSWSIMMRQFSEKNNANTWWILGWAICPFISYIYFIFIHNYYYTVDKELVKYEIKTVSNNEKRIINKDKKNKDNKTKKKVKKLRKKEGKNKNE